MSSPIQRPHMLVRLKPYNPTIGNVSKSKSIAGISFDEGQWVPIYTDAGSAEALLEYLRAETQEVAYGPLAFDVCTPNEAAEIRRRERMANLDKPAGQAPVRPVPPPPGTVEAGHYTPLNEPAPESVLDLPPEVVEYEESGVLDEDEPESSPVAAAEPPPEPKKKKSAPKKAVKAGAKRAATRRRKTKG